MPKMTRDRYTYMVTLSSKPLVSLREQDQRMQFQLTFRKRTRALAYARAKVQLMVEYNGLNWCVAVYKVRRGEEWPSDLRRPMSQWCHVVDLVVSMDDWVSWKINWSTWDLRGGRKKTKSKIDRANAISECCFPSEPFAPTLLMQFSKQTYIKSIDIQRPLTTSH